ncbi:Acetyltransferase (GNAT) family protein [Thalassobacillus cyri]|uniref:Acetyltransferase (GNAT) family protein n=1 Tax=Thalassobacillus cyri TaxID=571932 RepID=A0A1H4FNX4_9BACI|nr:GNAT family N-acetyltransferase [Thalassobacillus cyri]SEA98388.1 Acetyltransferase (GNAT) family protein [Thalassobacillus cyri]
MKVRNLHEDEKPPIELLLEADPSRKLVVEYVQRGDCRVAESDGNTIGVYVLLPTRPGTVELVNIAIAESHRGKGLGKQLVMDAIQVAKSRGFQTMELGTGNSSVDQLALYQKCGFRMVSVEADFFIRHYEEEIYENGIQCRDMIRLSLEL